MVAIYHSTQVLIWSSNFAMYLNHLKFSLCRLRANVWLTPWIHCSGELAPERLLQQACVSYQQVSWRCSQYHFGSWWKPLSSVLELWWQGTWAALLLAFSHERVFQTHSDPVPDFSHILSANRQGNPSPTNSCKILQFPSFGGER